MDPPFGGGSVDASSLGTLVFLMACYLPPRLLFSHHLGAGLTPATLRWIGGELLFVLLAGGALALAF